jgi:hypothetical protein
LQDFGIQHAETLQSLQIKINKNRQEKRGFIQFLTGDSEFLARHANIIRAQRLARPLARLKKLMDYASLQLMAKQ